MTVVVVVGGHVGGSVVGGCRGVTVMVLKVVPVPPRHTLGAQGSAASASAPDVVGLMRAREVHWAPQRREMVYTASWRVWFAVGAVLVGIDLSIPFSGRWEQTGCERGQWYCWCLCFTSGRSRILVTRGVLPVGAVLVCIAFAISSVDLGDKRRAIAGNSMVSAISSRPGLSGPPLPGVLHRGSSPTPRQALRPAPNPAQHNETVC